MQAHIFRFECHLGQNNGLYWTDVNRQCLSVGLQLKSFKYCTLGDETRRLTAQSPHYTCISYRQGLTAWPGT
jgi:hypothetical protein